MRVVVCSLRGRMVGQGDAVLARDLAELLIALDETTQITVVVDVPFTPIELPLLARLARDFPMSVAVLVSGSPVSDRKVFYERGFYRAQFEPIDDAMIPADGSPIDRAQLIADVTQKLERQPTPLASPKRVRG